MASRNTGTMEQNIRTKRCFAADVAYYLRPTDSSFRYRAWSWLRRIQPGHRPGGQLAFWSAMSPDPRVPTSLHIIDLNSREVQELPNSRGLTTPRWSPDGMLMAAIDATTLELKIYNFATGVWKPVHGIRAGYPSWSSDGRRLFFESLERKEGYRVMAVDISAMKIDSIATFDGLRQPMFSFGGWLGLGPEASPLALRDLSTEEILRWKMSHH